MNFETPSFEEGDRKHFLGKHALEFGFEDGLDTRRREYISYLERVVNNDRNFIDKGGAGEVYAVGPEKLCIKLMYERRRAEMLDPYSQEIAYNLGNSVKAEAWFLEQLSGFQIDGVRSPALVEYMEGPKYTAIVMERLPAANLQRVINGTEPMPANFQLDSFFDELEAYLYEMYEEKKIVHGDLEPRNVMVDKVTGKPRIIDFGRAVFTGSMSEPERHKLEMKEIQKLDDMKRAVAHFLNNQLEKRYA